MVRQFSLSKCRERRIYIYIYAFSTFTSFNKLYIVSKLSKTSLMVFNKKQALCDITADS